MFFSACSLNQRSLKEAKILEVDENLLSHINYILYLIKNSDLNTINKVYVNNKFGLYEVDVLDSKIVVEHKDYLDEIDNYVGSFDIKEEDVNFYCSPYNDALYGWDKDGVFISKNIEKYLLDYIDEQNEQKKEFIDMILGNSFEVIVTYNIIFYFTKIDDKFYITLIDKVKTDCSNLEI